MRLMRATMLAALVSTGTLAYAQGRGSPTTPRESVGVLRALFDCRALTDDAARLACYDAKVGAVAAQEKSGELVVADKGMVRESKKALFGFGGLNLPIFGSNQEEAPKEIQAKVRSARVISPTRREIVLDNGMAWRQVDDEQVDPVSGQQVTVRVAAMGSFMMKVGGRAIRVMRVR